MSDDQAERTFDATPKRREQFRKDGRFARSRDAGAIVTIIAVIGVVVGTEDAMSHVSRELLIVTLGDIGAASRGELANVRRAVFEALAVLIAAPLIAAAIAGTVAGLAQAGMALSFENLGFKPERLNPMGKLKEMLSPKHGAREVTLALFKVALVGSVTYSTLKDELPGLIALVGSDERLSMAAFLSAAGNVLFAALGMAALMAGVDYAQSRFQIESEMKMTLKELKDEMKSEDGNPQMKAKMRSRARAMSRKRMMQDVKTASVVVTNPTHVAVALRYGPGDPAPIVVAKGHDHVALAIRREARKHGVVIVENRALARTLDADLAIGKPVKMEHFSAVAKILAFVFRMRKPRQATGVSRATR